LSVDDDENTREMLQEALERAGAVVESAASAQEALDKLGSFAPHVLLSDIGLPDEDGYDLMRRCARWTPRVAGERRQSH
jgi:CheY-like chemotaxis protein